MSPDTLRAHPYVVAPVCTLQDLAFLDSEQELPADLLEFRLDDFSTTQIEETALAAAVHCSTPLLITARRKEEGSRAVLDDDARLALYGRFMPRAALVDTEVISLQGKAFSDFPNTVHAAGALLVGSYHDFVSFPGMPKIERMIAEAYMLGADIAKVAVMMENLSDLYSLAAVVEREHHAGRLISAMGMGPLGKLSRLVLAKAGSCLNYGYLREANAPGQWSAEELRGLLRAV
jgi:3-dehydroquinate dehydratase I